MNSNFLSKVYGVNGYRLTNMCHKDNKTILKIERKHVKICCAACGNIGLSLVGSRMRDILGVPSGLRKTVLRVRIRRYAAAVTYGRTVCLSPVATATIPTVSRSTWLSCSSRVR